MPGKSKRRSAFVPTKAGDGGALPKVQVRIGTETFVPRNANSKRAMTCVARDDWSRLRPTRDPFDRAHGIRDDANNMLKPAGITIRGKSFPNPEVTGAPRLWPLCYMTGAGVSFETAAEDLFERERRLDGIPGIGVRVCETSSGDWVEPDYQQETLWRHVSSALDSIPDGTFKRDIMRAKKGEWRSAREIVADRAADLWAASRGVNLSEGSAR